MSGVINPIRRADCRIDNKPADWDFGSVLVPANPLAPYSRAASIRLQSRVDFFRAMKLQDSGDAKGGAVHARAGLRRERQARAIEIEANRKHGWRN